MSLGNHLRGLREQAGLTQRDVARRMGCADSTVSMIETDTREPRLKMLRRYCDALGARVYIGFPTKEAP